MLLAEQELLCSPNFAANVSKFDQICLRQEGGKTNWVCLVIVVFVTLMRPGGMLMLEIVGSKVGTVRPKSEKLAGLAALSLAFAFALAQRNCIFCKFFFVRIAAYKGPATSTSPELGQVARAES